MVLGFETPVPDTQQIEALSVTGITFDAISPELRERYLGDAPSAVYLIRPDQHVVARWHKYDAGQITQAIRQAIGKA